MQSPKKAKTGQSENVQFVDVARTILVTGGTGLVGRAIQSVVDEEQKHQKAGPNEKWVFLGSKDGDLRCVCMCIMWNLEILSKSRLCLRSTSRPTCFIWPPLSVVSPTVVVDHVCRVV